MLSLPAPMLQLATRTCLQESMMMPSMLDACSVVMVRPSMATSWQ
jgi:hypothetical protein